MAYRSSFCETYPYCRPLFSSCRVFTGEEQRGGGPRVHARAHLQPRADAAPGEPARVLHAHARGRDPAAAAGHGERGGGDAGRAGPDGRR